MLRIEAFDGRTARARCITMHLWTAHLWLACLPSFLSTGGFVMISSHHQSPLLSPPCHVCLRHTSHAQARAPTAPSSYHDRQIVRSPAFSRPLHSRFLCLRPASWAVASAIPAPSLCAQGMTTAIRSYVFASLAIRALIAYMILLLAYLPGW